MRHVPAREPSAAGRASPVPARRATRPPVRPLDDGCTERVRLIEFIWAMHPGHQPVILVERKWLH